jgi:hypothetical protein
MLGRDAHSSALPPHASSVSAGTRSRAVGYGTLRMQHVMPTAPAAALFDNERDRPSSYGSCRGLPLSHAVGAVNCGQHASLPLPSAMCRDGDTRETQSAQHAPAATRSYLRVVAAEDAAADPSPCTLTRRGTLHRSRRCRACAGSASQRARTARPPAAARPRSAPRAGCTRAMTPSTHRCQQGSRAVWACLRVLRRRAGYMGWSGGMIKSEHVVDSQPTPASNRLSLHHKQRCLESTRHMQRTLTRGGGARALSRRRLGPPRLLRHCT